MFQMNRFNALAIDSDEDDYRKPVVAPVTQVGVSKPQGLRDRLQTKQNKVQEDRPRNQTQTQNQKQRKPERPVVTDTDFPVLNERVKSTPYNVSGTWKNGVDTIRMAKSLPDPVKLRKQLEQEACRQRLARLDECEEDELSDCEDGVSAWQDL
jgi:hypothetical protein